MECVRCALKYRPTKEAALKASIYIFLQLNLILKFDRKKQHKNEQICSLDFIVF